MNRMLFLVPALSLLSLTVAYTPVQQEQHANFSTVTGYFLQDLNTTNATTFNYTATNFGLINRTYPADATYDPTGSKTQWQRFANQIGFLNRNAPVNTDYKLLFLGRHGDGLHNDAESYYGTPAWNCYWSLLDGNSTVTWADANLSTTGVQQAQVAHNFWAELIADQKIVTPQTYYTSPLYRCLLTANITFAGLDLPPESPFIPQVKELARESLDAHTCDRRHNKTYISNSFPTYTFEGGFAEGDILWNATYAETNDAQDIRSKTLLDDIFGHDPSTYISITSHSGEIASMLRVLGHQTFSLATGAVIPVLVKYEIETGKGPLMTWQPWTTFSHCSTRPPLPTSTSS